MNLKTLILSPKAAVKTGDWKRGGEPVPRALWPSRRAKAKAYKFGSSYLWRVVSFVASGRDCRLMLLFNAGKQIFRARFGVIVQGETVVLCDYEFHASEPGWHGHFRCGDLDGIIASQARSGGIRLPSSGSRHRRMEFRFRSTTLTEQAAFNAAVTFFRLDKGEGDRL